MARCLKSLLRTVPKHGAESSPQSGEMFMATQLLHQHNCNQRNAEHFAGCGKKKEGRFGVYKHCVPTARSCPPIARAKSPESSFNSKSDKPRVATKLVGLGSYLV
jgi:hypothetical protein